jgi:hypothetical protein
MRHKVRIPEPSCTKGGQKALDSIIKALKSRSYRYALSEEELSGKQKIINTLYSRGWDKLTGLFSDKIDSIDAIKEKLDYFLDKGGDHCKYGVHQGKKRLPQSEVKNKELYMSVVQPLYNVPEIADILFDDRIIDIAKCYFKCMPAVGTLNLRKSFANNLPDAHTTIYHCDNNSPYMLKFFLYLDDVDEMDDGPLTYVEGSAYQKPKGWLEQHRVPDKQIEKIYGKERIKPITAKKGDVFVAITTGYHKGQKVVSKDRGMLTLNFVCAPENFSVETQYDIHVETCTKLSGDKLPLIDFLYITE